MGGQVRKEQVSDERVEDAEVNQQKAGKVDAFSRLKETVDGQGSKEHGTREDDAECDSTVRKGIQQIDHGESTSKY
jgi:hypothetical protein